MKSAKPTVSVILPVYNAEKYIEQTIGDICAQTYEALELIIVNDGSTDHTGSICKSWRERDERIRCIEQENAGVGAARNRGVELAGADYIMFVDADDRVDRDFVEKMLEPLITGMADLSVCDIDNVDAVTGEHAVSGIRLPYGISETKKDPGVISKIRTFCWGKIYKKSLWTDHGIRFPEGELYRSLPGFEDVCTLPLIAAYSECIAHVESVSYHYYRGHENSLMHKAGFAYFLNSQIEVMHRFVKAGLEPRYHGALRRFMLGQLSSANRFRLAEEETKQLWEFVRRYFPEIASAQDYRIYAPEGIYYDVLRHVFFDRSKFVDREGVGANEEDRNRLLKIKAVEEAVGQTGSYESICYDMADRIIDRLPDIISEDRS